MNFAIGYAHYQLAGGNRALVRWCIGFVVIAALGLTAYGRIGGGGTTAALASATTPAVIVVGILLVIACNIRIGAALKLDNTLDMARSHRLMAVSAPAAILGYLFGSTLPLLATAGLATLYAASGFIAGGYDVAALVTAVLLLAALAALLATLNVLGGVSGKSGGGIGWIWGVGSGAFFGTGGAIFAAVPWTAVLAAPFSEGSVLRLRSVTGVHAGHAIGAFTHLALAGLFFHAACRKWRRADRPALSPLMWLGLLAIISLGTLAGVHYYEQLRPGPFGNIAPSAGLTIPGTLTLLALLAHGPLSSHEKLAAAWRLRKNVDDPAADEDRPALRAGIIVALLLLVAAPLALLVPEFDAAGTRAPAVELPVGAALPLRHEEAALLRSAWPVTAVAFAAAMVTAWAVMRGLTRLRAGGYVVWVYAVLWVLPAVIAAGARLWLQGSLSEGLGPISALGFPSLLFYAWGGHGNGGGAAMAWAGVGVQVAVAAVLVAASLRVPDKVAAPATRDAPARGFPVLLPAAGPAGSVAGR